MTLSGEPVQKIVFRNEASYPSTTYATFGLYRYPAKFIPQVVAYILKNYSTPGMKIFDPFAGYGTVGVVARLFGCDYELWDINPMLKVLHRISIAKPIRIDITEVIREMKRSTNEFIPEWKNLGYWYDQQVLSLLSKVWGYYYSLNNESLKQFLMIPLLKTSRTFSFDDSQRMKLSKSKRSVENVKAILRSHWEARFFSDLETEMYKLLKGQEDYWKLNPKSVRGTIRIMDTLTGRLRENKDILITSPPYLQSQEYIRQAKMDLFWLGFKQNQINRLSKLEIPYREIKPIKIESDTFEEYRNGIYEPHIQKIFDRYFWGTLGSLTRLQENIMKYMFIFVGHSSTRGRATPIDRIFIEHLEKYGWIHVRTLSDTIVNKRLFDYKINPASKLKDERTSVENLVILKRL